MNTKTFFLFIISLLLIVSVNAQDFNAYGETFLSITPCSVEEQTITIENTRGMASTFSIEVEGNGADFVKFSTLDFTLPPGESKEITVTYDIPCTAELDTYFVDVYFFDGFVEKGLLQDVQVAIPDNLDITLSTSSQVVPPCDAAVYTINLHNPLDLTEVYHLEATGHKDVKLAEEKVILRPTERKSVPLTVTPEDCTDAGSYEIELLVYTEKSQLQKEFLLELIISPTDIPLLAPGISKIRTDYVDSTVELSIQNIGDRQTSYTLFLHGIGWGSLNPESVKLNPGEVQNVALRLAPGQDIPKGTYPAIFVATVDTSSIQYTKDLEIVLGPPTLFERNPVLAIFLIILLIALIVGLFYLVRHVRTPEFKEKRRKWKEKRKASKEAKLKKRAEKRMKNLDKQKRRVEKRQSERERLKKRIQQKLEREFKKDHYIVANKNIIQGKQKSKKSKVFALIFALVILVILIIARNVILPNLGYLGLGIGVLVLIWIIKKISRSRTVKARWKTLIEKKQVSLKVWKRGLRELQITPETTVKKFKLRVKRVKPEYAPSHAVYETFNFENNAEQGAKVIFAVPKKWMTKHKADVEKVKLARYANNRWTNVQVDKIAEDNKFVRFTAEIKEGTHCLFARVPKPVSRAEKRNKEREKRKEEREKKRLLEEKAKLKAIAERKKRRGKKVTVKKESAKKAKKPKKKSVKRRVIAGIIALAIVVAVAIILAPSMGTGIPSQIWKQDTVHEINLGQYFEDPDKDSLLYSMSPAQHISAEFSGSKVYLTPETGWIGSEQVTFTATDMNGGSTNSNVVPLIVKKRVLPTAVSPYISIALALIAVAILIWIAATVARSKKK